SSIFTTFPVDLLIILIRLFTKYSRLAVAFGTTSFFKMVGGIVQVGLMIKLLNTDESIGDLRSILPVITLCSVVTVNFSTNDYIGLMNRLIKYVINEVF